MPKKVKKRIRFKIIPIFIFIILMVGLYFLISCLADTKIKNIYIYNNELLSDQEIIELAKLEEYPSFYKTSNKSIKNNLKKSKLLKSIKIKRDFFNIIRIYVVEYKPLFIKDNKVVLENGFKIDSIEYKVPILSNINEEQIYNDLIKAFNSLNYDIKNKISEIIYKPNEYDNKRFLLYMDDGNHVYINIPKIKNLNYYNEIYPSLNNKKGILYLDSGNHFEIFK